MVLLESTVGRREKVGESDSTRVSINFEEWLGKGVERMEPVFRESKLEYWRVGRIAEVCRAKSPFGKNISSSIGMGRGTVQVSPMKKFERPVITARSRSREHTAHQTR